MSSIRACRSSRWDTLHDRARTSNPLLSNSLRTSSQASAFLLQSAILAPARASSSAIDLPMPRVAPVTSATLPFRSKREATFLFHYVKSDTTKLTCEGVATEYRNAKHSAAFPTRIDGGEILNGRT